MKKQIITIAGRPGSGKSSAAKGTAKKLGFEHFSSGDLFRSLGRERGVNVLEANLPGVTEELDELVDAKLREIGSTKDELVIDSRTAWHWIPTSFKVFLDLDMLIAASRILDEMSDARLASEHIHREPAEYAKILQRRLDIEAERYRRIYGIDPYDPNNYDLVIDTNTHNSEQTIKKIIDAFMKWRKS